MKFLGMGGFELVIILIVLVQIFQSVGNVIVKKTDKRIR